MDPLLTICIPTYRRAKLLRRCLHKLYECGDLPVRVIVGNNASPDDTEDEVRPYLGRSGFHYFRNEQNIGGDRNLVKILGMVETKFFMILTDDDYVDSDGLRKVLFHCQANPDIGAIISPLHSMREDGRVVHIRGKFTKVEIVEPSLRSIGKYADLAWAWSRLVFARTAFDLAKARETVANCYFMIIMLADVCRTKKILIIPDRVVFHTIDNEVFWETLGPTLAGRKLSMEQNMLAAIQEIYRGNTAYEWWQRKYYQNLIAAKYICAADGLQALKKIRSDIFDDEEFVIQSFKGSEKSGPSRWVFPLARLIQFKRYLRVRFFSVSRNK